MKKSYTKDELDRFYTKDSIVDLLLSKIDLNHFELIVEPSAGNGSFSNKIKDCLAFDIAPQHSSIIKQDFLDYHYTGNVKREKILCIGNPPYGRRCSVAIKFIKQCALFADHIGFILPLSFKKDSIKNRIPQTYHLKFELPLPDKSFLLRGNDYPVPCLFQLWNNLYKDRPKLNPIKPIGFEYAKKEKANFTIRRIGRLAGKGYNEIDKSTSSHYFIKTDSDSTEILKRINAYQWDHENTVGPKSISKPELNKVLNVIIADCKI